MKRITKEQRKRYNQYADQQTEIEAKAAGSLPFFLIIILVLAYASVANLPKPYGGYIAVGFCVYAAIIAIASLLSGHNHNDFQKH